MVNITPKSAFLLALFGPAEPEPPPPRPSYPPIIIGCGDSAAPIIHHTILRQSRKIRHCYTRARTRQPELVGKLVVKFTIRDGFVHDAHLKQDDIGDKALAACVLDSFWLMRMPLSEQHDGREIVVTYPLLFVHAETKETPVSGG
ncbi:MAG: hypothetical protein ACI8RZ_004525 [Myxococcota bacterium]|jgi:hypothetical protein